MLWSHSSVESQMLLLSKMNALIIHHHNLVLSPFI